MNRKLAREGLECGGKGLEGARHRFGLCGCVGSDRERRRRSPLPPPNSAAALLQDAGALAIVPAPNEAHEEMRLGVEMDRNGSDELGTAMTRLRISLRGAVQGVGFRPFIYRLATELRLSGWVNNTPQGVILEVEGEPSVLAAFLMRLPAEKPPPQFHSEPRTGVARPSGIPRFRNSSERERRTKMRGGFAGHCHLSGLSEGDS